MNNTNNKDNSIHSSPKDDITKMLDALTIASKNMKTATNNLKQASQKMRKTLDNMKKSRLEAKQRWYETMKNIYGFYSLEERQFVINDDFLISENGNIIEIVERSTH